jgi:hypothetical protein
MNRLDSLIGQVREIAGKRPFLLVTQLYWLRQAGAQK